MPIALIAPATIRKIKLGLTALITVPAMDAIRDIIRPLPYISENLLKMIPRAMIRDGIGTDQE
jgi:hypothetical protein